MSGGSRPRLDSLVIATTNPHKLREILMVLDGLQCQFVPLDAFPLLREAVEDGPTFMENARMKARYYAGALDRQVVCEDSGLEVEALEGAPGVQSARFNGERYDEKFSELFRLLRERDANPPYRARFTCVVCVAWRDRVIFETRGTVDGELTYPPRGEHGFGYDPIFYYPPLARTFGELAPAEKQRVSHRARAFQQLRRWLQAD